MAARIAFIAPFIALPGEPQASRFVDLARQFSNQHQVELVSSTFQHFEKRQRNNQTERCLPFATKLLPEPGYSTNISFTRLKSHQTWLKQVNAWLADNAGRFDLIYCACPFTRLPSLVSRHSSAPIIADVQDLWPQTIITRFMPSLVSRYASGSLITRRLLAPASGVIAVSRDYLDQVQCSGKRPGLVVPHGVDLSALDAIRPKERNNRLRLIFVGTIGDNQILDRLIPHLPEACELVVVGEGPALKKLRNLAALHNKHALFTGALEHKDCLAWLKSADIALNAIHPKANIGATNKIAEFLACGLPILSSQAKLARTDWHQSPAFMHFEADQISSFHLALETLKNAPAERARRAQAARNLAQSQLDRHKGLAKIQRFCERFLR